MDADYPQKWVIIACRFTSSLDKLEAKKADTATKLANLNKLKLEIYSSTVKDAIEVFGKIVDTREISSDFYDKSALNDLFKVSELEEMKITVNTAREILKQVNMGTSLVEAASTGSLTFMGQFGVASTGTAITSLSGAAATNATLAALGGGSLATGGGGMALGSSVLGGVTILPAAMVMSWKYAQNSEKALTKANTIYADTKKEIGNITLQGEVLKQGVDPRINELSDTLKNLSENFTNKVMPELIKVYNLNRDGNGKVSFQACSETAKSTILLAAHYIKGMTSIMRVKVMDESGNPSTESKIALHDIQSDQRMNGVA